MLAIIIGFLFAFFGLWGLVHWFHEFVVVMEGFLPISILIGGIVSIIAGISGLQDRVKNAKKKD